MTKATQANHASLHLDLKREAEKGTDWDTHSFFRSRSPIYFPVTVPENEERKKERIGTHSPVFVLDLKRERDRGTDIGLGLWDPQSCFRFRSETRNGTGTGSWDPQSCFRFRSKTRTRLGNGLGPTALFSFQIRNENGNEERIGTTVQFSFWK